LKTAKETARPPTDVKSYAAGRTTTRRTMKRILGLIGLLCVALAPVGSAHAGISFGISEDRARALNPDAFFGELNDLGVTQNRAALEWDPANPDAIPGDVGSWLQTAQNHGIRIVLSLSSKDARDLSTSGRPAQFAAWAAHVAQTFPQVKDYVIGNEPNQPYFWLPQFDEAGRPLSAAAYEPVLAQSYDALKAVDPTIDVIGIGLSPRGNDNPFARSNKSRSPVRFIHDLGIAYRASGRTKPLMDELGYHPYPAKNTDAPGVGYAWPNAGLPNLDRVKQAVWDAFNGTAQPTFAETGRDTFAQPLKLELDELGWQVAIPPQYQSLYFGTETYPTVDEPTQAEYYADSIGLAECDPSVSSLSFFLLRDEPDLSRWQSGLEYVNGVGRQSYTAVKQTIAQTQGNCQGAPVAWRHASQLVQPVASWGNLTHPRPLRSRSWAFVAGARELATFRAGIFRAGTSKSTIAKALTRGRPKPLLYVKGLIKAKNRIVRLPARLLKQGRYVYAIRMTASMNPRRSTQLVSRPFRVGR
jgi:hypothetical protein